MFRIPKDKQEQSLGLESFLEFEAFTRFQLAKLSKPEVEGGLPSDMYELT